MMCDLFSQDTESFSSVSSGLSPLVYALISIHLFCLLYVVKSFGEVVTDFCFFSPFFLSEPKEIRTKEISYRLQTMFLPIFSSDKEIR